jgi:histone H3/H4
MEITTLEDNPAESLPDEDTQSKSERGESNSDDGLEVILEDEVDLDIEESKADAENLPDVSEEAENADPTISANSLSAGRSLSSKGPSCPLDLPISVVRRIMKSACPSKRFTPELISTFSRVGGAFGLYLLSACQDATTEARKSTIEPIRIIEGLLACGFPELAEEARIAMGISMSRGKKKKGKRKNIN